MVLAAVDCDLTVTRLAGDFDSWRELSGKQLDTTSPLAELVARTRSGQRSIDDIEVGGRAFSVTCDPGSSGDVLLTAFDVTEQTEARQRLEEVVRSKDCGVYGA